MVKYQIFKEALISFWMTDTIIICKKKISTNSFLFLAVGCYVSARVAI